MTPFYMTCYAIRGDLTYQKLGRMVGDQIMGYIAKFQLKIPNYLRVIYVFIWPPFYITCIANKEGGRGLTNQKILGIAEDKIMG